MNLAPPVYQFLRAATGGAKDWQLDIRALLGIRTRDLWFIPNHFTAGRQDGEGKKKEINQD